MANSDVIYISKELKYNEILLQAVAVIEQSRSMLAMQACSIGKSATERRSFAVVEQSAYNQQIR